jgi:hypothetical protein
MAVNGSQLGQVRPADTTAASIYSPAASIEAKVTAIMVCNTTTIATTFRIFHDDNGTTYDADTALYYDVPLAANDTVTFEVAILMNDATGNLAVRSGTGNAVNFTVYGFEKDV